MKQEIISREVMAGAHSGICGRYTITLRQLKCGHEQLEPHGSKAKFAKFAMCTTCDKLLVNNKALLAGPGVTTLDPVD